MARQDMTKGLCHVKELQGMSAWDFEGVGHVGAASSRDFAFKAKSFRG
jgi:hypothetical protein